jgi:hypothetical protein
MCKENDQAKEQHIALALKPWDNSLDLLQFFYQHRGTTITENYKKLKFWQKHLLETNAMDSLEFRKEFQCIVDMVKKLKKLGEKFTEDEIHDAINSVALHRKLAFQSMNENYRKEAQHA